MDSFNNIPTLTLNRVGMDATTGYEKGYLTVDGMTFSTRERGHEYVSLMVGTYRMKHSIKGKGRRVKCLRPVEWQIGSILIHDAYNDKPGTLEGCIAPGFMGGEADWSNSAFAMDRLWDLLGGWQEGKEVDLVVLNNVSYENSSRSRDNWSRFKRKKPVKK